MDHQTDYQLQWITITMENQIWSTKWRINYTENPIAMHYQMDYKLHYGETTKMGDQICSTLFLPHIMELEAGDRVKGQNSLAVSTRGTSDI